MADDLERPGETPEPHLPPPSIWPFGFAAGIALVLIGIVISWPVVAVGVGLAIVFGFLWVRDMTREVRRPEAAAAEAAAPAAATSGIVETDVDEAARYTRSRFLEGSTLGIGAIIGGVVTVPALGFAIAPAFVGQGYEEVDLGPLENFPEGEFVIATFSSAGAGTGVSRRTAYVRNNGFVAGVPSFTILSSRCVHLGCPVQPNGPQGEATEIETEVGPVVLTPTQPAGFGCPCHGGAYDNEGNRTAGPPVRSLDRYAFLVRDGNLVLTDPYSVGQVEGQGADARIEAYKLSDPGVHVDGPVQILYPWYP